MAGVTREHERLIKYVEPQGVSVTRTKKGLLFRFPNGETEMIHFTQSDWRATRNARANFRRNGVEWPGDLRGKKPYKATVEKVRGAVEALVARGEEVTSIAIKRELGMQAGAENSVKNAMIALGWWHDYRTPGSRQTLVWHPPLENGSEVVEEVEDAEDDNGDLLVKPPAREFIDTVDSWCVDVDTLDQSTTVAQLRAMFAASGLKAELRAWRAPEPVSA